MKNSSPTKASTTNVTRISMLGRLSPATHFANQVSVFGRRLNGHIAPEHLPLAMQVIQCIESSDCFARTYPQYALPGQDYLPTIVEQERRLAAEVNTCMAVFGGFDVVLEEGNRTSCFRLIRWQGTSPSQPDQHVWSGKNMPPESQLYIAKTALYEIRGSLHFVNGGQSPTNLG